MVILLVIILLIILCSLYKCFCIFKNIQNPKNIMLTTNSKYSDKELVLLNKEQLHMKATIINPKGNLTDKQIIKKNSITPNDYRFNICGETLTQDPRIENKNYDKPLGLMCRNNYRENIISPFEDSYTKITQVRGHKECKST